MSTFLMAGLVLAAVIFVGLSLSAFISPTWLLTRKPLEGLKLEEMTWLNSPPLSVEQILHDSAGKPEVALVNFWEYTCANCVRTLPHLRRWQDRYTDAGLLIVGVHAPEFNFGRDVENVRSGMEWLGIDWPVVLDNDYTLWRAFHNSYWPRLYVLNSLGEVVHDHVGEGGYEETERAIQHALHEINPAATFPRVDETDERLAGVCYPATAEIYCSSERGRFHRDQPINRLDRPYEAPDQPESGAVALQGRWQVEDARAVHTAQSDAYQDFLAIRFHALEVNVVIEPPKDQPETRARVTLDGKVPLQADAGRDVLFDKDGAWLLIREPRMYNVLNLKRYGEHDLRLQVRNKGVAVYAFTFGACTSR